MITIGGWERLLGASVAVMTIVWAGLYVLFAFLVMRWSRGILPVAAALAIILAIFAAIAAPDWFARSKDGLDSPALPEDLLGLLTLIVVPQLLLVIVAMIGFNQDWHVEEERRSAVSPCTARGPQRRRPRSRLIGAGPARTGRSAPRGARSAPARPCARR